MIYDKCFKVNPDFFRKMENFCGIKIRYTVLAVYKRFETDRNAKKTLPLIDVQLSVNGKTSTVAGCF